MQQLFEQWAIHSDIFQLHDGRDLVPRVFWLVCVARATIPAEISGVFSAAM